MTPNIACKTSFGTQRGSEICIPVRIASITMKPQEPVLVLQRAKAFPNQKVTLRYSLLNSMEMSRKNKTKKIKVYQTKQGISESEKKRPKRTLIHKYNVIEWLT
ncbi:hypothetical protein CRM22_010833 [Opisthorchis felineus]|uniref:Uncharacterized protein n=1 Tax=Opisthorchis felineus TaxID=147828 RepID=A0A4S2KL91_OPIFE|nr:hypothetical protein CRM22_010833 [Opisthorchis felineus]